MWLRTTGCIATKHLDETSYQRTTEYEKCIPYGRPLFEILYKKEVATAVYKVMLERISTATKKNKAPIMSDLGTRV